MSHKTIHFDFTSFRPSHFGFAMSKIARHNSLCFPGKQRFELRSGPGETAFISYRQHEDTVIIEHTYVPERLRGKGIAASITHDALLEARRLGWKIVPDCSYTESYIQRHPEFIDLLHKP